VLEGVTEWAWRGPGKPLDCTVVVPQYQYAQLQVSSIMAAQTIDEDLYSRQVRGWRLRAAEYLHSGSRSESRHGQY
jgi:hypothetical protein